MPVKTVKLSFPVCLAHLHRVLFNNALLLVHMDIDNAIITSYSMLITYINII